MGFTEFIHSFICSTNSLKYGPGAVLYPGDTLHFILNVFLPSSYVEILIPKIDGTRKWDFGWGGGGG